MKEERLMGSSISRRDAAKAAVTIIALLFVCIALGWVITRVLRPPQSQNPPANAAPLEK